MKPRTHLLLIGLSAACAEPTPTTASAPPGEVRARVLGTFGTLTTSLAGSASGDSFGVSLGQGGDIDGDGYSDAVVGYLDSSSSDEVSIDVYLGTSSGLSSTPTFSVSGTAGASGADIQSMATIAGDIDADGYDDLLFGDFEATSATGKVTVYYGSASGPSSSSTTVLTGPITGADFGLSVAGAGDVDDDGYIDVIVGAPAITGSGTPHAYVFHGSASGLATTATTTLSTTASGTTEFGYRVAGAGDVNGDGYDDVLVGAPATGATAAGTVYLFQGSTTGVSTTADRTLSGSTASGEFGSAVTGIGDSDDDGYDDVAVGAWAAGDGAVSVYLGSSTGLGASASVSFSGSTLFGTGADLGYSVAALGDVDDDGYPDLGMGAPGATSALVAWGSASGLSTSDTTTLTDSSGTAYGAAIAGLGDVNGDGYDDIAVGDPDDDSSTGQVSIYHGTTAAVDADGDGVDSDSDCDDEDPAVGAPETLYADSDGDGYGDDSSTTESCPASGLADVGGDCDDEDADVNPSASETCNEIDDDCDGDTDEGVTTTYYTDSDGDGYGDESSSVEACSAPSGWDETGGDCDDTDEDINPSATETCNEVDDNCDGDVDEGLTTTYYADSDGDGYGADDDTVDACEAPTGYIETDGDCDDSDEDINPDAVEICNGEDDDCNGTADDGLETTYYLDADEDGWGVTDQTTTDCETPDGYAAVDGDCDDTDPDISPGADEIVGDSIDEDCDGTELCYDDSDLDGYYNASGDGTVVSSDTVCGKIVETDEDAPWEGEQGMPGGDCDDDDPDINPGATEIPDNGVDEDCDGEDLVTGDGGGADGGGEDGGAGNDGGDPLEGEYGGGWACSTTRGPGGLAWLLLLIPALLRRKEV